MGTAYWVAVRTGQDTYDAYDAGKVSSLIQPFWAVARPQNRREYVSMVWDFDPYRWHHRPMDEYRVMSETWLYRAANHLWDWFEPYGTYSADVRVFNDCSDDVMTVGGAMHKGGMWRPGIPLLDVKRTLDAVRE